jgi:asparagine N-glycosylation enzyme membrane subunit Stt3
MNATTNTTGRARSTTGQPFTLNTYKMDDHDHTDRNTLTIWNDDETEVLVHEAEAYVTHDFIWYVDPTTHDRMKLMLGPRERAVAHLYCYRLEYENRLQRPLSY